jgi:sterol 3beta-glucosyltransferase
MGRGFGGVIFKTMAAVIGLPAYTLKGAEKHIKKRSDRDLKAEILAVRLRQSLAAFRRASKEDKQEILKLWNQFGAA